jgi:endonuclease/exonuclease/phosphatase family metal-dependent hydrolase
MGPTPSGTRVWRWGRWESSPSSFPPVGEPPELKFLEFNMYGSFGNKGDIIGVVNAVRDTVLKDRPDIMMFNEVCLGQADRLWSELDRRGFETSACYGATTGKSNCTGAQGAQWYGNAVYCRATGIGEPEMIPLPNPPKKAEQRAMISMVADVCGVEVSVSAVHLVPRGSNEYYNRLQITEVIRLQTERAAAGGAVVFGGDLNARPEELRQLGLPGSLFQDVDHARNAPTFGRKKIDYIFLDRRYFSNLSGVVTRSKFSDHRPLKGRATLRVEAGG